MKTQALKKEIIEWITETEDNSLLITLKNIKDSNANCQTDWFNELSDEQLKSLLRGIENHEKGEVLTSKDFWEEYGKYIHHSLVLRIKTSI